MGALAEKTLLGIREDVSKTLQVSSVVSHLPLRWCLVNIVICLFNLPLMILPVVLRANSQLQSLGISQERADEICPVAVPEVR